MRKPTIVTRLRAQLLEPVMESIAQTLTFIASKIVRVTALLRSANNQPE